MSNQSVSENDIQWDYLCPQFCDFNATETPDQLAKIDNFFEVDHELPEQSSFYGSPVVMAQNTPTIGSKPQINSIKSNLDALNDSQAFNYETPPQNKENTEEDEEVFYSTKKYFSVEKKSYKLRSTPMRILQYNGSAPLRETRVSSKKKRTSTKKIKQVVTVEEDRMFAMERLLQSLPDSDSPTETRPKTISESVSTIEPINQEKNEIRIQMELSVENQEVVETYEELILTAEPEEILNEVFTENENQNCLPSEPLSADPVINKRESYVIEKAVKTVTLVSPQNSPKISESTKKRSNKRRGTPVRRSVLGSKPKVSTSSVVSRLYSSVKKPQTTQYKSMAELLKEFETQTRDCDRSRSVDRRVSAQRSRSSSVSSLTQPKSPKLHSIHRHRPTPRQTEDIIASQIKKYAFKANPIRKKLFDANFASGIPKVKSSKAPTKAVPMNFQTEIRNELRKHSHNDDKPEAENKFRFKANPMPAFRAFNLQTKSEKKVTAFKPFSFDDKIQDLVAKKRTHSEDIQQNTRKDENRNAFKL